MPVGVAYVCRCGNVDGRGFSSGWCVWRKEREREKEKGGEGEQGVRTFWSQQQPGGLMGGHWSEFRHPVAGSCLHIGGHKGERAPDGRCW